jgi:hypothetical protein
MIRNKSLALTLASTLVLAFTCSVASLAQSRTVDRFMEAHRPSQKFFLYPSTLRMVNLEKNPDFYAVVREIDKLRVLMYDKAETGFSAQTVHTLSKEVQAEEYEELMTFQTKEQRVHLYSLGEDDTPEGVVGLVETDDTIILTDLEGFVNLPALLQLFQSDFNIEDVAGLVNIASRMQEEAEE